jgi:hypothetical protein
MKDILKEQKLPDNLPEYKKFNSNQKVHNFYTSRYNESNKVTDLN